ncbi:MAG: hypothetical protein DRO88_08790 [Promethearchaeia archaeon]|nr:MAG: hypothetical protein DRO88_08790 [Candidatus Lokiarchaeia archaeon]
MPVQQTPVTDFPGAVIVLLVTGVVALLFCIFLILDYLKNKKLPHLFIAIAFFVVFAAGVLLVIINDYELLMTPVISMLAVFIPGGIATALLLESVFGEKGKTIGLGYAGYIIIMAIVIIITKAIDSPIASIMVMLAHIPSGLAIVILPILVYMKDKEWTAILVSVGGLLISVAGILLAFLVSGNALLSAAQIFNLLPWILLLVAACFAFGFLYTSKWTFKFPLLKP